MEMNAEEEIKKLFEGVIPERSDEIKKYMDKYNPYFSLCDDRVGFVLEAGAFGIVKFTHRTSSLMWLLGFAAKQASHSYSSLFSYLLMSNMKFDSNMLNEIPDQDEVDKKYNEIVDTVYKLAEAPDFDNFVWPSDIPNPINGKPASIEDSMVFDLNCMAIAYVFFHEMKHIAFSIDNNNPSDAFQEEVECDKFARDLMVTELTRYSKESGYPLNRLKSKRAMGMALGAFYMLVITPKNLWGGSSSHPSISDRINVIIDDLQLPDNDIFWIYLAPLFLSQLRYIGGMPKEIEFTNIRGLCLNLIECVNTASKTK